MIICKLITQIPSPTVADKRISTQEASCCILKTLLWVFLPHSFKHWFLPFTSSQQASYIPHQENEKEALEDERKCDRKGQSCIGQVTGSLSLEGWRKWEKRRGKNLLSFSLACVTSWATLHTFNFKAIPLFPLPFPFLWSLVQQNHCWILGCLSDDLTFSARKCLCFVTVGKLQIEIHSISTSIISCDWISSCIRKNCIMFFSWNLWNFTILFIKWHYNLPWNFSMIK